MNVACLPFITQKEVLKSYELEFMGGQKLTEIIQYMVYWQKILQMKLFDKKTVVGLMSNNL